MPFRCKCGRTFEKLDGFGSHTSGCAPFHHRRLSDTDGQKNKKIDATILFNFNQRLVLLSPLSNKNDYFSRPTSESVKKATSVFDGFMMPTALSIQNTFEAVRKRRSMSFSAITPDPTAFK
ncbi:hypothetical protein BDF21DRAFT_498407 [Thamnidium elegans]|uniref:Uncharacterized protein n=1 Tax=Thamnidium elegans TaxID=101142 RepID=A0A8H7SNC9_9FUNG|nr:hypothetical protein INT48_005008 [Thamnidium elegans]KAI8050714.1 hypothetical protein BDF21DRAFT_498407 [Thamnidium elegans]